MSPSPPFPDPRYPIGPAPKVQVLTPDERREKLAQLAALPGEFAAAFAGLDDAGLDTPYREGGWTLRQLAHHVADSHLNAYLRTKLALTEENPVIKPYEENLWAELPDTRDIAPSLELLRALHLRWAAALGALTPEEWGRTFVHPVSGPNTLDTLLAYYTWHGRHHTAHALQVRRERGW